MYCRVLGFIAWWRNVSESFIGWLSEIVLEAAVSVSVFNRIFSPLALNVAEMSLDVAYGFPLDEIESPKYAYMYMLIIWSYM